MPSNPAADWRAIAPATGAPQSPPCATYRVSPRRFISSAQACAMRSGSQPVLVGLPENPYPGNDGITTLKASSAAPPNAVGSVSGPMTLRSSITEPGQPWVMIIGSALL